MREPLDDDALDAMRDYAIGVTPDTPAGVEQSHADAVRQARIMVGWLINEVDRLREQPAPAAGMPHPPAQGCTCFVTDESMWTRYGDAVEPGSMYEPNPECPEHGAHTEILASQPLASGPQSVPGQSDKGTGVSAPENPAQAVNPGESIADYIGRTTAEQAAAERLESAARDKEDPDA